MGESSFSVIHIRLNEPAQADAALKQAESYLPKGARWTDLRVDGVPARQFEIPGPKAMTVGRLVAHRGNLYQWMAGHPQRSRADRFLNSFHFIDTPSPGK